jgi:cyclophilin family peptidyl-prolyl cis-trans isomerase
MKRLTACGLGIVICGLLLCGGTAFAGPQVKLETTMGDIVIELDRDKAPKTVNNFLAYVRKGFYDGTIFHRVIGNFMIQGGGLTEDMQAKPTDAAIENEAFNGLLNKKYAVAMARTGAPHSATAQFFINVQDNPNLDFRSLTQGGFGYAVFGKVIRGQNVVDAIKVVPTGNKAKHKDVPLTPVVIKRATLTN